MAGSWGPTNGQEWFRWMERRLRELERHRHGPDVGADERTLIDASVPFPPYVEDIVLDDEVVVADEPSAAGTADTLMGTATTSAGPYDHDPPVAPSTPVPFVRLGSVTVGWDGVGAGGEPMPPDLAYVEVHRSTEVDFVPTTETLTGRLYARGLWTMPDQAYGSLWYYRLVAVDSSGNSSGYSEWASAVTTPLVNTDVIGQIIDGANIVDGTLVASDKIVANTITGGLIQALAIATGHLAANAVTADKITAGAISTDKLALGVITTNPVPDPSFEEPYALGARGALGWAMAASAGTVTTDKLDIRGRSGNKALALTCVAASSSVTVDSGLFAVVPGQTYAVAAAAVSVGVLGALTLRLMTGSTSATTTSNVLDVDITEAAVPPLSASAPPLAEEFALLNGTVDIPSGHVWAKVRLVQAGGAGSTVLVDDVSAIQTGLGGATEITAAGVRLFYDGGDERAAMVSNRPNTFSVSAGGSTLAGIDQTGGITARTLDVAGTDQDADGQQDVGLTIYGTPFEEWLLRGPRGLVRRGRRTTAGSAASVDTGYLALSCPLLAGRSYLVECTSVQMVPTVVGQYLENALHLAVAGGVTTSSPQLTAVRGVADTTSVSMNLPALKFPLASADFGDVDRPDAEFLVTYSGVGSNASPAAGVTYPVQLTVTDVGTDVDDTGVDLSSPPPSGTKRTYVTYWVANSSETYRGDLTARTDTTDLVQGRYTSLNGDQHALVLFTAANSTGGQVGITVATAMSGATLTKAEVYLFCNHSWFNSGGTAFVRGSLHTSLTGTAPTGAYTTVAGWKAGAAKYVNISPTFTTSSRAVTIGKTGSTSLDYYMRFNGHTATGKPVLKLTYTK